MYKHARSWPASFVERKPADGARLSIAIARAIATKFGLKPLDRKKKSKASATKRKVHSTKIATATAAPAVANRVRGSKAASGKLQYELAKWLELQTQPASV